MKLYWTPQADQDREAIYDYIEADNPLAALELDELFEKKVAHLPDNPGLGRRGRLADTRELVVHKSYVLVYDVQGETVRILRVMHTRRQWPPQE